MCRVVIADDHLDSAELLAEVLRLEGHSVQCAADGAAALELYHQTKPNAMFVDIGMPVLDGAEVARLVRKEDPSHNVLLIAVTGWARASDVKKILAAGFDFHLLKPVDLQRVVDLVVNARQIAGRRDRFD